MIQLVYIINILQINYGKAGIVVRILPDSCEVITQDNEKKIFKFTSLIRRNSSNQKTSIDSKKKTIEIGDKVMIIDGKYSQYIATIKHIYKAYLFLICNTITENNGIIVTNHRNVKKEGEALGYTNDSSTKNSTLGMYGKKKYFYIYLVNILIKLELL